MDVGCSGELAPVVGDSGRAAGIKRGYIKWLATGTAILFVAEKRGRAR